MARSNSARASAKAPARFASLESRFSSVSLPEIKERTSAADADGVENASQAASDTRSQVAESEGQQHSA